MRENERRCRCHGKDKRLGTCRPRRKHRVVEVLIAIKRRAEPDIFSGQRRQRIVGAAAEAHHHGLAAAGLRQGADTADDLIVEGEATLLGDVLTPRQLSLLDDVYQLVLGELGISFDLDDAATLPFAAALDLEAERLIRASLDPDHAEAVRAFVDKRAPQFNGR